MERDLNVIKEKILKLALKYAAQGRRINLTDFSEMFNVSKKFVREIINEYNEE
jgi:DNA-binding GntR family transcriptional regulator